VLAILVLAAGGGGIWLARRGRPAGKAPFLVIGIDGGEWRVLRRMWRDGELPNLRRLAEQGTSATLQTAYNASPVIWTTIATGVTPQEHGITDFVVPSPRGDVPISSAVRRAPALWTMLTEAHRRVGVLGWWGSWPAETVNGVVVSDRALLPLPERVFPAAYLPKLADDTKWARTLPFFAVNEEPELRDAVMAAAARRLVRQNLDLLLLYFRTSDIVSHHHWKDFEAVERGGAPGGAGASGTAGTPGEVSGEQGAGKTERSGGQAARPRTDSDVQRIYRAIDNAFGEILRAAPGPMDVLVISDHGFRAARREELRTVSDVDALLVRLGYQTRNARGIDLGRSRLYTYGSPTYLRRKLVRCCLAGREPGGTLTEQQCEAVRDRLEKDLDRVTFGGGEPAFFVRDARGREQQAGADFVTALSSVGTSTTVLINKKPAPDVVTEVSELSGTHDSSNNGILIAAGPDIAPGANLDGITVHDITPTVLFGLGLPVAENFVGRAWPELFTAEFRRGHPPRTIHAWAGSHTSTVRSSVADDKLIQELRSLGYLR
jgi:predicted AlkP superfamily phosphohydrolase/phosphomutase